VTQDGEKYPAYNMALDKMELVDEKFKKLYYRFKASDNLYVDVAVGGDCKFKSHNEAIRLLKCLDIRMCLLYSDRLEYYMNGTKVISTKYEVVHGEDIFDTPKAREELWEHMVCNEIPYHQNVYKMNFSKVFLLSKERFLIR
jgi:hypothetical protein